MWPAAQETTQTTTLSFLSCCFNVLCPCLAYASGKIKLFSQCGVVLLWFDQTCQEKCISGVNVAKSIRSYLWVHKLILHKVTVIFMGHGMSTKLHLQALAGRSAVWQCVHKIILGGTKHPHITRTPVTQCKSNQKWASVIHLHILKNAIKSVKATTRLKQTHSNTVEPAAKWHITERVCVRQREREGDTFCTGLW